MRKVMHNHNMKYMYTNMQFINTGKVAITYVQKKITNGQSAEKDNNINTLCTLMYMEKTLKQFHSW